jgi:hypothetical protein
MPARVPLGAPPSSAANRLINPVQPLKDSWLRKFLALPNAASVSLNAIYFFSTNWQ